MCHTDVPRNAPARIGILDVLPAEQSRPGNGAHVDVRHADVHGTRGAVDRAGGRRYRHVSVVFFYIVFFQLLHAGILVTPFLTRFE